LRAQSADGGGDEDRIDTVVANAVSPDIRRLDAVRGTDAWAVKPWPEHGLLGSQLGPNKNGQKW
jgi:3',5'-cyclic-AMP phosphodiesterase